MKNKYIYIILGGSDESNLHIWGSFELKKDAVKAIRKQGFYYFKKANIYLIKDYRWFYKIEKHQLNNLF